MDGHHISITPEQHLFINIEVSRLKMLLGHRVFHREVLDIIISKAQKYDDLMAVRTEREKYGRT